jgi:hypothetical protein
MEQEMHDLEIPEQGDCRSFDNLDCRLTTGRNGRYTDCREVGVPAQ